MQSSVLDQVEDSGMAGSVVSTPSCETAEASAVQPAASAEVEASVVTASQAHTRFENVAAIVTASAIMSLGLYLLKSSGAATGGSDGIALLLHYHFGINLGLAVFCVAVPFYALAFWQKGWLFTARTVLAVTLISLFTFMAPHVLVMLKVNALYGAVIGNTLVGLGVLILFRHDASAAGLSIVSLILQERLGLRAGVVQVVFDVVIVSAALSYASPMVVLISACGVAMIGFILTMNHKPGRYSAA